MAATVGQLLQGKGQDVWSVKPETPVLDALKLMADKSIGAVVVMEGDKVAGIFSERDYARSLGGKPPKDTPVADLMSRPVYCIGPEKTIDDCMALMTARHIRHLPVLDGDKLVGIITIGDVVKKLISEQQYTIKELENYIKVYVK